MEPDFIALEEGILSLVIVAMETDNKQFLITMMVLHLYTSVLAKICRSSITDFNESRERERVEKVSRNCSMFIFEHLLSYTCYAGQLFPCGFSCSHSLYYCVLSNHHHMIPSTTRSHISIDI